MAATLPAERSGPAGVGAVRRQAAGGPHEGPADTRQHGPVQDDVTVAGIDLVLDKPYSRRPRLLRQGGELPRDRWGTYELVGADGRTHRVATGFDYRQLGPVLDVDGTPVPVGRPPPLGVRIALLAVLVVGLGAALPLVASAAWVAAVGALRAGRG